MRIFDIQDYITSELSQMLWVISLILFVISLLIGIGLFFLDEFLLGFILIIGGITYVILIRLVLEFFCSINELVNRCKK